MATPEWLKEMEISKLSEEEKDLKELQDEVDKKMRPLWVFKRDMLDNWVNSLKNEWKLNEKEMKDLQDSFAVIQNNIENFLVETESAEKYYIDSNKLISCINENLSNQQKQVVVKVLNATNTERSKLLALQIVEK